MKTKKLTVTGMFAALIFVITVFIKIPVASGYIHPGDAVIYLGAFIIGSPYILIAGAIGEGFADLAAGYPMYIPATVLIKIMISVPFIIVKKRSGSILSVKSVLMTVPSGLITVGGYFIADYIIDKSYAVTDIPGNVIQALGSAVIFVILAAVCDRYRIIDKLDFR